MSNIEIKGNYSQKTEIFGKVISHHTGTFDLKKDLGDTSWSQPFGPVTITEAVQGANVTVTISAFGISEQLFKTGVGGKKTFKVELDTGNFATGTVTLS